VRDANPVSANPGSVRRAIETAVPEGRISNSISAAYLNIPDQNVHGIVILDTSTDASTHRMQEAGREFIGSHKSGRRLKPWLKQRR
jgi:hypothetical protein